jgi:hypothetical protein
MNVFFTLIFYPDGRQFRNFLVFNHTVEGFNLSLFHDCKDNKFDAFIIEPLVTNCNKNMKIRKVENNKNDFLSIDRLIKFRDAKVLIVSILMFLH